MGLVGRREAISAPTVGYASDNSPISTARTGSALSPLRRRLDSGVAKPSKRVSARSSTHAAHNDHASLVAVRVLTPPIPRSSFLASSVTILLYSTGVSQAFRPPLRNQAVSEPLGTPSRHLGE